MLGTKETLAVSEMLFSHWQSGRRLSQLPANLRPTTRSEGYAIQAHLESRSQSPLVGWKIAATSTAGQQHINVDGPIAGRILAECVHVPGSTVPLGNTQMRVAEPEFVFRMERDLKPRCTPYSMDEVLTATGELHLAIEIPDSRFEDFTAIGAAHLIADNSCAHVFVIGNVVDFKWRDLDLSSHQVIGKVSGKPDRAGSGKNVLGDPRLALTWLANELSQQGTTLNAGQVVSTGTCMTPIEVKQGDEVIADFGELGQISVHFS